MKDYEYIEMKIAEARRLRSEAVGELLAAGWHGLTRLTSRLLALVRHDKTHNSGPYLPA